jgi:3-hydroxybutyryl-CoA dehydrogenase
MQIQRVGVIGAGVMGIGLSTDLLLHNIACVLVDISEDILAQARREITRLVRFAPLLDPNLPKVESQQAIANIQFTTRIEDVGACDFIVENATEDWNIKQPIYHQLSATCPKSVVFAANTSCISITKIGAATDRPDNVIGTHFMNPVYLKTSVEVIKGYHTSDTCIHQTNLLLKQLGKEAIIVNDLPGFVSNRISHLFMNEAAFVVQDGVASPEQVDAIFKKCFGHKMGPLETADLIGLDTVVASLDVLYQSYQDSKFRCCPLLRKMVDAQLLGKKTGRGFYTY